MMRCSRFIPVSTFDVAFSPNQRVHGWLMKWNLWESFLLVFFCVLYSIHSFLCFWALINAKAVGKWIRFWTVCSFKDLTWRKGTVTGDEVLLWGSNEAIRLHDWEPGEFGWWSKMIICREGWWLWNLNLKVFAWEYTPRRNIIERWWSLWLVAWEER